MEVAARRGIDLTSAYPKPLPELSQDDLVISVCDRAHDTLAEIRGARDLHWSVPDPAAANAATTFDQATDALTDRIASCIQGEPGLTPRPAATSSVMN